MKLKDLTHIDCVKIGEWIEMRNNEKLMRIYLSISDGFSRQWQISCHEQKRCRMTQLGRQNLAARARQYRTVCFYKSELHLSLLLYDSKR